MSSNPFSFPATRWTGNCRSGELSGDPSINFSSPILGEYFLRAARKMQFPNPADDDSYMPDEDLAMLEGKEHVIKLESLMPEDTREDPRDDIKLLPTTLHLDPFSDAHNCDPGLSARVATVKVQFPRTKPVKLKRPRTGVIRHSIPVKKRGINTSGKIPKPKKPSKKKQSH